MFEKEARENAEKKIFNFIVHQLGVDVIRTQQTHETVEGAPHFYQNSLAKMWKEGAEFGYNKANEWHFVKDGDLPKVSDRYWVYTGGEPFTLDFDTEVNAFGYWCLDVGDNLGVRDTIFETVAERNEDKVIAWKEIVPPELPKEG